MKKLQNQYNTYDFGGFNLAGIIIVIGPILTVIFLLSVTIGWGWAMFVPIAILVVYGIFDEVLLSFKKHVFSARVHIETARRVGKLRNTKLAFKMRSSISSIY